ncbi:large neutral amino acids transporter small subunit 2-like [Octopus sinensis]|uniref:Large neutral amino acids transporter small subunit 2-like n=1 Tax=Octopus sinensis TaxID=2607531 RepID=A0A7E6EL35_9MOLL|nr:large neutral amino acids transporter small subunit 2-like [Octopus sinensis]
MPQTGSTGFSLLIWISTGFISLTGGLCYAELGSAITKSGGEYAYLGQAYGNLASFLYSWTLLVIILPASISVTALAFGQYTLKSIYTGCHPPKNILIIVSLMAISIGLNCVSARAASMLQNVFTAAKVISLLIIISMGIYELIKGIELNSLNTISEELKKPKRDIPIAIVSSLLLVTSIYTFVNFVYFIVIPKNKILLTDAIGLYFNRIFFVAGRDGNLPKIFSLITIKFKTPFMSIFFTLLCLLCLFYIFVGIFLLISSLFADPVGCGLSLLMILVGIPTYYIFELFPTPISWDALFR